MELFLQILSIAAPFVTGYLGYVIALRKLPGETQRVNIDSAAVASKALIDLLNATQAEREHNTKRIDALEAEIETIKEARRVSDDEKKTVRESLEARVQAELIDSKLIRIENQEKDKRITKLEETIAQIDERHKVVDKKYRVIKGIALKVIRALQENDPPIAIPELNGDIGELGESGLDLPLTDEQKAKLKGAGK